MKLKVLSEHLRKELADTFITKDTNRVHEISSDYQKKFRAQIDELKDMLNKERARNQELAIRIIEEERRATNMAGPQDKPAPLLEAESINASLKKRIEVYGDQQRRIIEYMNQQKQKSFEPESFDKAFHSLEAKNMSTKFNFEKVVMRLKTTSQHSVRKLLFVDLKEKYAEILDIVSDLFKTVTAEIHSNLKNPYGLFDKHKERENEHLLKQIKDPNNYK